VGSAFGSRQQLYNGLALCSKIVTWCHRSRHCLAVHSPQAFWWSMLFLHIFCSIKLCKTFWCKLPLTLLKKSGLALNFPTKSCLRIITAGMGWQHTPLRHFGGPCCSYSIFCSIKLCKTFWCKLPLTLLNRSGLALDFPTKSCLRVITAGMGWQHTRLNLVNHPHSSSSWFKPC
jgi:hypothetical protein